MVHTETEEIVVVVVVGSSTTKQDRFPPPKPEVVGTFLGEVPIILGHHVNSLDVTIVELPSMLPYIVVVVAVVTVVTHYY